MVRIPSCKGAIERRYERGTWLPAVNVKVHHSPEWTAERLMKEYPGLEEKDAEWCVKTVYESMVEDFWNYIAPNSLNFAMHGDDGSDFEPTGIKPSPYTVYADGRMGGWLVVTGLGDIETWDAVQVSKWRKFCRLLREAIAYNMRLEAARELIDANEWATKPRRLRQMRAAAIAAGFGEVVR